MEGMSICKVGEIGWSWRGIKGNKPIGRHRTGWSGFDKIRSRPVDNEAAYLIKIESEHLFTRQALFRQHKTC
jgi:hypothetical protein